MLELGLMLGKFLLRWGGNSLGLWLADRLLGSVNAGRSLWVVIVAGLIFSLVNALVRPLVVLLSLPAILLTLGFFLLVVNGFMLYLVTVIYPSFQVLTFSAAITTVIIVWLVNYALSMLSAPEAA